MAALRWKKQPKRTGLARIGARPQSSNLRDASGKEYATVYPLRGPMREDLGWYWVSDSQNTGAHENTCNEPVPSEGDAKDAAKLWVLGRLKRMAGGVS